MLSHVSQLVMSGGFFPNQTCTEMSIVLVTLLWSAMGKSLFLFFDLFICFYSYCLYLSNMNGIVYTCVFFSLPGPCMFSEDSLGRCSMTCLSTAHPAARPLWQRRVACRLGRGCVASGAEVAASLGSPALLMEASHLSHSAPLNQVRKTLKPLCTLFYGQLWFLHLPKFPILHTYALWCVITNIIELKTFYALLPLSHFHFSHRGRAVLPILRLCQLYSQHQRLPVVWWQEMHLCVQQLQLCECYSRGRKSSIHPGIQLAARQP